ncbi:MAG: hypothetical protein D4R67_09955 [Bacteroidetes bacterium]|nr:MAG: hypothetical protein D4R67_09955 [Bacteroidota bacterium]
MWYLIRRVLFLGNVILFLAAFALCIYAVARLILAPDTWLFCLLLFGIGVVSGILLYGLYLVRKSRFPLPGIDYK